MSSIEDDIGET